MLSLSPEIRTFLYRALFSASIGYLGVALIILRPDNWFGLAHCAWAIICVIGSRRAFKVAKQREAASK
jgi:hypothetical protein